MNDLASDEIALAEATTGPRRPRWWLLRLRLLYLLLGGAFGILGGGLIGSYRAPAAAGIESSFCVGATSPLAFRDPPPQHEPFQDWVGQLMGDAGPRAGEELSGPVHPGGTAVAGIRAFSAGDRASAEAAADRLLSIATPDMFFPYQFDEAQHGMKAPWTSAYAQGLALVLFTELGRPEAAAIAKTIQPDKDGWFQEYPGSVTVLNGHTFASIALWRYWRATGDEDAKARALAGIEVVRRNVHRFFTDRDIYLDTAALPVRGYYWMVYLDHFDWLWAITGESCFLDVDREVYRQWFLR